MPDSNKLAYQINELPSVTGFGRSKIYEEIKAGRLSARKIGSRTIVLATDLEEFLKDLPVAEHDQMIKKPQSRGQPKNQGDNQ